MCSSCVPSGTNYFAQQEVLSKCPSIPPLRPRATVEPLRTPGDYRRFTLQMLRDIIVAIAHQGWFSTEDIRYALRAVITARYRRGASHGLRKTQEAVTGVHRNP